MEKRTQDFIKTLRIEKGYTQEDLAHKIGVSLTQMKNIENGHYEPSTEILQQLIQELDLSIEELEAGQRLSNEEKQQRGHDMLWEAFHHHQDHPHMSTQFIIFAIACPLCLYILSCIPMPISIMTYHFMSLLYPFLFIFGLIKCIEAIIHHQNYFWWFCLCSISFFLLLLAFMWGPRLY